MAIWDDIYNWVTQPGAALATAIYGQKPSAPSPMLAPGTEQKAANYFMQTPSPNMALLPQTTAYTQSLVKQGQASATPSTTNTFVPNVATGNKIGGLSTTSPNPYDALYAQYGGTTNTVESITPYQQAQLDWEKYKWNNPQPEVVSPYQQQQLQYQQQQLAADQAYRQQQLAAEQAWRNQQLEAERQQRLATLAAQPKSWLEYAAYANQTPVVQPWMLPLMTQDYMKTQPVGSPISGWTPENMKGMPDLINPSAQYMARMGPTAQQQYYAYQQADQGMTPEESQWRLWSQGPPDGSNKGLAYQR